MLFNPTCFQFRLAADCSDKIGALTDPEREIWHPGLLHRQNKTTQSNRETFIRTYQDTGNKTNGFCWLIIDFRFYLEIADALKVEKVHVLEAENVDPNVDQKKSTSTPGDPTSSCGDYTVWLDKVYVTTMVTLCFHIRAHFAFKKEFLLLSF